MAGWSAARAGMVAGEPSPVVSRNHGLDIARAAAIALVLQDHLSDWFLHAWPAARTASIFLGGVGVELFFSLSGFLIGRLLIRLVREGAGRRAVGRFLARRWLRTLPLYYVVLVGFSFCLGRTALAPYLFLQNWGPFPDRILVVSWSLVLEEYFYFFFPLLLAVALAVGGPRLRSAWAVAALAVLAIVGCTAARTAVSYGLLPVDRVMASVDPFLRLDCAAYGVLAACVTDRWPAATARVLSSRVRPWVILGCIAVAGMVTRLFVGLFDAGFDARWHILQWYRVHEVAEAPVLEAVFALLVVTLSLAAPRGRGALAGAVTSLSVLSYAIYLVHVPLIEAVVIPWCGQWSAVPRTAAALVIILAGAWLAHRLVERPFLALRDRFVPG